MIDWGAIVSQAPSIAMSLVFAWFALELIKSNREHSKQIMGDWAKRLDEWNTGFKSFVRDRDEVWQKFLEEQRKQQYDATGRLAEEIKRLSEGISSQTAILMAHDKRAQEYQQERRADLEKLLRDVIELQQKGGKNG